MITASWLMQTAILVAIGALAWFMKGTLKTIEDKICANVQETEDAKKDIRALEAKFNDYRERAAMDYVHKEEFIRAVTLMEKKLDKIYDLVALGRKEAS